MKKLFLVIGTLLLIGVGLYGYRKIYTLWMPIGDATTVSYNHELNEDGSIHIYCPCHSAVEAAMGGKVMTIRQRDSVWEVVTYNHRTGLTSIYSPLDTVFSVTSLEQGDTIGYTGDGEYLQYQLMKVEKNDTLYINPAPKFDKNF